MLYPALLLLLDLLVSGISGQAPTPCKGCVSHSWKCSRNCLDPPYEYTFNGTYTHQRGTCFELIPYNATTLVVDGDLWCSFPQAQQCRTPQCREPLVGCDNMNTFKFSGLSLLEGCSGSELAGQLVREECDWICKHNSPYSRCSITFDPWNVYGLRKKLESCWVKETCTNMESVAVDVTCKPEEPQTANVVEVSGVLTLSVKRSESLVDIPAATSALKEGIASSLVHVTADMVEIAQIVAVRRLRWWSLWRRLQQSVSVEYRIIVPDQDASAVTHALTQTSTTVLASNINAALESNGIVVDISVTAVSEPSARMKYSAELQASQHELQVIQVMKDVVEQHLQEALRELEDIQKTLQNTTMTQGLTAEEFKSLESIHQEAQARLQNLMHDNEELQQKLHNVSVVHNQTHNHLAEAQAAAAIARGTTQQALADLSSLQSELSTAETTHDSAGHKLDEALKQHNMTLSDLASLKSSHSEVTAELKALEANHSRAMLDLVNTVRLHAAAERSAEEAEQARDKATQELDEAKEENKQSQADLEAALLREDALNTHLANVSSTLTNVRMELWALTHDYNMTSEELKRTKKSLADTIDELIRTQKELEKEKETHEKERDAHKQTKETLTEEQEESQSLLIVSGALAFFVIILLLILCFVYRFRKTLAIYCLRRSPPHTNPADNSVVVGRPVGDPEIADKDGSKDAGVMATGLPTDAVDSLVAAPLQTGGNENSALADTRTYIFDEVYPAFAPVASSSDENSSPTVVGM